MTTLSKTRSSVVAIPRRGAARLPLIDELCTVAMTDYFRPARYNSKSGKRDAASDAAS